MFKPARGRAGSGDGILRRFRGRFKRLEQTDEFIRILHGDTEFPASYFFDVRYSLKRIRPEGTWLDERELFDLKRSLQTINDIVRFFKPMDDEEIKYPALTELAGDIFVFPN